MTYSKIEIEEKLAEGRKFVEAFAASNDVETKIQLYVNASAVLDPIADPECGEPRAAFYMGLLADKLARRLDQLPFYRHDIGEVIEDAVTYYRLAASMEIDQYKTPLRAQHALAIFYTDDFVVDQNSIGPYDEAFRLMKIAADGGLPDAFFGTAMMYAAGCGVERSDIAALEWIEKAYEKRRFLSREIRGLVSDQRETMREAVDMANVSEEVQTLLGDILRPNHLHNRRKDGPKSADGPR